jgi:protein-ribulosamine 3-kinase
LQDARWNADGHSGWGQSFSLAAGSARYFVKAASGRYASTVEAEADGLAALATTRTIRVPQVVAQLTSNDTSILVLEWLDLRGSREGAALGRALAALHRSMPPHGPGGERFGWHCDNWIGGTPQQNGWSDDWCTFFRDRRLAPQLDLAMRNGGGVDLERAGERLLRDLASLLGDRQPQPSLLHGDLWSGNAATLANAEPAVFDPAVYVGDREADIAMTELFGRFGADFYATYREAWPLDADYAVRRDVYNLYHVLNHFNLFGGGYLAQAKALVARLLAVIK